MTDERIIAYLLEELRPEEAERFEEDCFAAESWPDELSAVEEELIEDYLRGGLTPERRRRFESHYLTTAARRERVRVAAALLRHADEAAAESAGREEPAAGAPTHGPTLLERLRAFWGGPGFAPRAAAALALLAVIAAGLWWVTRDRAPRQAVLLTLNVASGDRSSGARPAAVALPPEADALRVTLTLPAGQPPADRYRAELEGEHRALDAPQVVSQDDRAVTVLVPAGRLSRGSYVFKLYAVGPDGTERRVNGFYFFDIL